MDILAVYPVESELKYFEKMPPLGMLWVAGELRKRGYGVEFIDLQVDERDPARRAAQVRPRLALIGGTSHTRFASFEIAARIKEASPETFVVYGGPHATFTAEDTLTHVPAIDFIVRGEGEATCSELAEWADHGASPERLREIAGISYRVDGTVVHNAPRASIEDVDALGPPDRDLVPMDRYDMKMEYLGLPGTSIMTARGCPIACTFCSASAMFGTCYRHRSHTAVVDEIESLITNYGAQGIKIFDSTFTLNRRHAEGVCLELKRRGIRVPWECEIRVGSVDKKLLGLMQEAGCYYVDVGVESGSQRVLDQCIKKRISLEEAEELLRWTHELGLLTKVFFTLGHPGETLAEGKATNRFIRRHRRHIRLAGYHAGIRVYPGTEVETFAREHDLLPPGFRWSAPYVNEDQKKLFRPADNIPVLLQPGMGLKELRRLRIGFILDRIRSPRFVYEKMKTILRSGALGKYLQVILEGVGRRTARAGAGH